MKATDTPRAPFLIGFVLAIPMERYYYLTDSLNDGLGWLARPWVIVFLAVLVLPIVWGLFKRARSRRRLSADDRHGLTVELRQDEEPEEEGFLMRSPWSLGFAAGAVVVFGAAPWASTSFSAGARLLPQLVGVIGLAFALVLLTQELRERKGWEGAHAPVRGSLGVAARTFALMACFLLLVMLVGYLAAVLLFVPAYLLWMARARTRTTVIYGAVLGALLLVLPSLIPVDLPTGLLG